MADDPKKLAQQNRDLAINEGNSLIGQTGTDAQRYTDLAGGYRGEADTAASQLSDQPGYSPTEAAQIDPRYTNLETQQGSLNNRYLTDDEQTAMAGNPYAAQSDLNPTLLAGEAADIGARSGEQVAGMKQGLDTSNQQLRSGVGGALKQEGIGLVSAFGDEKAGLTAAVDPAKLGLSSDFSSRYQMTPQQQQDMVTAAGTTVGNRYRSDEDTLARQAQAEGNSSPLAVAAATKAYENESAAQAGDAMTTARIAAADAAAKRLQTSESMRLGTEQDISSRQQQNAGTLGQQQLAAVTDYGKQGTSAAEAENAAERAAATSVGQAGVQAAEYGGTQVLNTGQANQAAQLGVTQTGEQEAAARAKDAATNRQATTADVQNTGFTQGMTATGAEAAGAGKVADTRIAGDTNYRNYLTGQQGAAQQGSETSRQQQLGAYGTQIGGANTATGTQVAANAQPGTLDKLIGAGAGAASAFLDTGGIVDSDHAPGNWTAGLDPIDNTDPTTATQRLPKPQTGMADKIRRYGETHPAGGNGANAKPWNPVDTYSSLGKAAGGAASLFLDGGGTVSGGETKVIGEHGPEAVVPMPGHPDFAAYGGMVQPQQMHGMPAGPSPYPYPAPAAPGATQGVDPSTQSAAPAASQSQPMPAQRPGTQNWMQSSGGFNPEGPRKQPGRYSQSGPADTSHPQSFADGGIVDKPEVVDRPTVASIGRRGPEAVVPFNRTPGAKMPPSSMGMIKSRGRRPTGPAGPHGPIRPLVPLKPTAAYR